MPQYADRAEAWARTELACADSSLDPEAVRAVGARAVQAATPAIAEARGASALGAIAARLEPVATSALDFKDTLEAATAVVGGDLWQLTTALDGGGAAGRALGAATIILATVNATSPKAQADVASAVSAAATAADAALPVVTDALEALAETGAAARFGLDLEKAARLSGYVARLTPALGIIASSASFGSRLGDDPHLGTGLGLIGDFFSITGSAISACPMPVTVAAGSLLNGLGTATSLLGDALTGVIERRVTGARDAAVLAKANEALVDAGLLPVDASLAKTLVEQGGLVARLVKLGATGEKLRGLLANAELMASSRDAFERFERVATALALKPGALLDLHHRIEGSTEFTLENLGGYVMSLTDARPFEEPLKALAVDL
jgi:hypothetical protein